jgi:hypothetical protein
MPLAARGQKLAIGEHAIAAAGPEVYNVRAFGAKGDGTTNDTAAFLNAWTSASAANGAVFCPAGVYRIDPITITMSMGNVRFYAAARAMYNAADACVLKPTGAGPLLTTYGHPNVRNVTIENIVFNGNKLASVGISLDTTVGWTLRGNYFIAFPAGSVAVKGGSNLFLNYEENSHSLQGYAWDFQNAYASVSTYYGCNVCTFTRNLVSAWQGARVSGNVVIERNDFELHLDAPAAGAIDISDPKASSFAQIKNNYFELTAGTAKALVAIHSTGNSLEVTGNEIFGDTHRPAGSVAIDAGTTYTTTIRGNKIARWATGVQGASANGNFLSVLDNEFRNVTTEMPAPETHRTAALWSKSGGRMLADHSGFYLLGRALKTSSCDASAVTVLDLSLCNHYYLSPNSATTYTGVTYQDKGQFFTVTANNGNVTLAYPAFGNCANAAYTLTPGQTLLFQVTEGRVVREVCPSVSTATEPGVSLFAAGGACSPARAIILAGAELGQSCSVAASTALEDGAFFRCAVTARNKARWQLCNLSGAPINRIPAAYTVHLQR